MNSFFANKDKGFLKKKIPLNRCRFKGINIIYDNKLLSFALCVLKLFYLHILHGERLQACRSITALL